MSRAKRASKGKRLSKAVPVLGIAGASLAVTGGGASAAVADLPTQATAPNHVITLGDEEVSDVSLSTFYVFDKENSGSSLKGNVREARGCGCGGRGCGGRGCGGRGCARGCARGCGCGGCGGCSCGC